jgi:hypothetical protein
VGGKGISLPYDRKEIFFLAICLFVTLEVIYMDLHLKARSFGLPRRMCTIALLSCGGKPDLNW